MHIKGDMRGKNKRFGKVSIRLKWLSIDRSIVKKSYSYPGADCDSTDKN